MRDAHRAELKVTYVTCSMCVTLTELTARRAFVAHRTATRTLTHTLHTLCTRSTHSAHAPHAPHLAGAALNDRAPCPALGGGQDPHAHDLRHHAGRHQVRGAEAAHAARRHVSVCNGSAARRYVTVCNGKQPLMQLTCMYRHVTACNGMHSSCSSQARGTHVAATPLHVIVSRRAN